MIKKGVISALLAVSLYYSLCETPQIASGIWALLFNNGTTRDKSELFVLVAVDMLLYYSLTIILSFVLYRVYKKDKK